MQLAPPAAPARLSRAPPPAAPPSRCACYTNCARWNDLVYKLIRTVDYGNEAGPVVDKVVEEVAAALAEVRRRIGAGAAAT